jgi:hypothetical protein
LLVYWFLVMKNLYVFFELGYFPILGILGSHEEVRTRRSYNNGIHIGQELSGLSTLLNNVFVIYRTYITNRICGRWDGSSIINFTSVFLTIDRFCIQFFYSHSSLFQMSFPLSIIRKKSRLLMINILLYLWPTCFDIGIRLVLVLDGFFII